MGTTRWAEEPRCYVSISIQDECPCISILAPTDVKAGESINIWSSPAALKRLRAEIDETLRTTEA